MNTHRDVCSLFNCPFAFRKVLPTVLAPFKLVIIKVSDLPETDFSSSKDNKKPEPYVRIRFTEIETGKVCLYNLLACCALRLATH